MDQSPRPSTVHHEPSLSALTRKLRTGCFLLEGMGGLGSAYYFNYLFFYLQDHFGFGNRGNLLITAHYGLMYMTCAWRAGGFAQRRGYFFSLRLGFGGIFLAMMMGAIVPQIFGYSHTGFMVGMEVLIVTLWTGAITLTWPTLQALLSYGQSPRELSRTAGIYNMVWSGASAFAYLTSGALYDSFGGEILFWVPAGLHLAQLIFLPSLRKVYAEISARDPGVTPSQPAIVPPEKAARARRFLHLAWIANPFAYVAIYGLIPVIPKLAQHFGLTATMAGFVCSVWQWTRLAAFFWFSVWPGWHYRFRWLLAAFVGMMAGFAVILLCAQLWILIAAQIVFGLSIGLIYYSSLFYSMDSGASRGKRGGVHEAAIGLGILLGPGVGVTALLLFPGRLQAAAAGMSALLIIGLILFLWLGFRERAE